METEAAILSTTNFSTIFSSISLLLPVWIFIILLVVQKRVEYLSGDKMKF